MWCFRWGGGWEVWIMLNAKFWLNIAVFGCHPHFSNLDLMHHHYMQNGWMSIYGVLLAVASVNTTCKLSAQLWPHASLQHALQVQPLKGAIWWHFHSKKQTIIFLNFFFYISDHGGYFLPSDLIQCLVVALWLNKSMNLQTQDSWLPHFLFLWTPHLELTPSRP